MFVRKKTHKAALDKIARLEAANEGLRASEKRLLDTNRRINTEIATLKSDLTNAHNTIDVLNKRNKTLFGRAGGFASQLTQLRQKVADTKTAPGFKALRENIIHGLKRKERAARKTS